MLRQGALRGFMGICSAILIFWVAVPVFAQSAMFVPNQGQWEAPFAFKLKLKSGEVYFEKDAVTFNLIAADTDSGHAHVHTTEPVAAHAYRMKFPGANPKVEMVGGQAFPFHHNYYVGSKDRWAEKVPVYQSITYKDIYKGIDLTWQEKVGHLEYFFTVQPGADAKQIAWMYEGIEGLRAAGNEISYATSVTNITEKNLFAYQKDKKVDCAFRLSGNQVGFHFPTGYDHQQPLVIDPVLVFSSFTGSFGDNFGFTATYDSIGDLYGGGIALDFGYPVTVGAYQQTFQGGNCDISISKFSANGSQLLYSTYLGGNSSEVPNSLIINSRNELMVLGITGSANFPFTRGAYDTTFNGGAFANLPNNGATFNNGTDIIICKLNQTGGLLASTFFGGTGNDGLNANSANLLAYNYGDPFRGEIILDDSDNVFVASCTNSPRLNNISTSAIKDSLDGQQDGLVLKMNNDLDSLYWQTYLGGTGVDAVYSLDFDDAGELIVTGGTNSADYPVTSSTYDISYTGQRDAVITKLAADGSAILQSTFLGTSLYDQAYFVKTGPDGNIYVVGQTEGTFPTTPGVFSVPNSSQFISCLTPDLDSLVFSTVFGDGNRFINISPTAFLIDQCGNIFVSGWGGSVNTIQNLNVATTFNLPVTPDAFQSTTDGSDFYFLVLSENADSLIYASYFGGPISSEHVDGGTSRFDRRGFIYQAVCAGCGQNSDFPTTPGVVSQTNNSNNCNLGVIKFEFEVGVVEVAVSASPSQSGCVPFLANFTATDLNVTQYQWDFGDGDTSNLRNPFHAFTDTGTFVVRLIGSNPNLCAARTISDTAYLTVVVDDDSVTAGFLPTIVSDCDSFVVSLQNTSTNATQYTWNFGDNTTSTLPNPSHRYSQAGTYRISLVANNPNGCRTRDSVFALVSFKPKLTAAVGINDTLGCLPLTVQFPNNSQGGGFETFVWSFGDGSPISTANSPVHTFQQVGNFTVVLTATDTGTCNITNTDTVTVVVRDDTIQAGFTLNTLLNVCGTLSISLTDTSTGTSNIAWDFGDGQTSSASNPTHSYFQPDTFQITQIVTSNACVRKDTATATVVLLPKVLANIAVDNGCVPYDLLPQNNSSNATSYLWQLSTGISSTDATPLFDSLGVGSYSLGFTAYNPNTCNDSASQQVSFQVFPSPTAIFDLDTNSYQIFDDVQFANGSSSPANYAWDFGDGSGSTENQPTHRYREEGSFSPCLTVTDTSSCEARYCKDLEITFRPVIDLPNAFSPNGDGLNDIFYVEGYGVSTMEFRIYNRWGELVFESDRLEHGWDGTYKGQAQEAEVYAFTLKATFKDGTSSDLRKGNITLLR
ncbi:MAG: PKD domain-containing protein [Chitinophagales bacterium]|nr:PKD domain-containing protein [Chitinophagales bacterium]